MPRCASENVFFLELLPLDWSWNSFLQILPLCLGWSWNFYSDQPSERLSYHGGTINAPLNLREHHGNILTRGLRKWLRNSALFRRSVVHYFKLNYGIYWLSILDWRIVLSSCDVSIGAIKSRNIFNCPTPFFNTVKFLYMKSQRNFLILDILTIPEASVSYFSGNLILTGKHSVKIWCWVFSTNIFDHILWIRQKFAIQMLTPVL